MLEKFFEKEPLRAFTVKGELCYLSSKMQTQLDNQADIEGNPDLVYQNNPQL